MKDFVTYNVSLDSGYTSDPLTVKEALSGPYGELWRTAMEEEYNSLIENSTWDLVDKPEDRKPINSKWVFKTKKDATGKIAKHKARLVIKGCAQKPGIDYEETYSPVVRYNSMRFLFAMAAKYDLDIDQMDAVTAFLQSDLKEEIYMVQPECFATGDKVCRLKKSIYGLKQASRVWNNNLSDQLKNFGMNQSLIDPCVYFKINDHIILLLAVYVDDLLIFSNNTQVKNELKDNLMKTFKMKDIGEAKYVLGMQLLRNKKEGTISISQEQYIKGILRKFNMYDCNPIRTPLDAQQTLTEEMCPKTDEQRKLMENIPYQECVGSLLYASQVSRPDICYAVNKVSRYNNNPGMAHWNAVKRIMRYLKGTVSATLEFSKKGCQEIIGYCDSDWAGDLDGRRSTSGYVFTLQNGPISWCSKRQATVALSTTEAEYMSMAAASQEALWLKSLQREIFCNANDTNQVKINCDNKSAINLGLNGSYSPRSKHIDVKYHFLRELVNNKKIHPQYLSTEEMIADVLTKPLPVSKHHKCVRAMGIKENQI